jgi:hypothetical protein
MTPVKKPEAPEAKEPIKVGPKVSTAKAIISGAVKSFRRDPERKERLLEARQEAEDAGLDWVEGKDWEKSQREPSAGGGGGGGANYPKAIISSEGGPNIAAMIRVIVIIVIIVVLLGVFRLI